MESRLQALIQSRSVCITTIPPRYDAQPNDTIHFDIALTNSNNFIRELISRMDNIDFFKLAPLSIMIKIPLRTVTVLLTILRSEF